MKEKKNVVWINKDLSEDIYKDENIAHGEDILSQAPRTDKTEEKYIDTMFSKHMSEYIGQTVTVYTTSESCAGCGITGVLIECTSSHIRLVTQIGPPPEKPKRKACRHCWYYKSCLEAAERLKSLGSVAEIPLCNLVVFVHNSL